MDIGFHCDGDCRYRLTDKRRLRIWLREVALREGFELGGLEYVFCTSERLLEMNRQFLGHDYFTDIITFDYGDPEARVAAGDMFIDVDTVADNARIYSSMPRREMMRVIVHGLLHLCGQGDKTPDDEARMRRKENRYLRLYDSMFRPAAQQ